MSTQHDALEAARELRGLIRAERAETEATRRLPPSVVDRLVATGLCRLAVPARLGGIETDPVVALQIVEELAVAEAAVAWIVWNQQLPCLGMRHLADPVRQELLQDPRSVFAVSTRRTGQAVVEGGGFRISGRWALVSGCELADAIAVHCTVLDGAEPRRLPTGEPETRMVWLQKGAYQILDTWHVSSLRGTGSHDVVVQNAQVPEAYTYSHQGPILASDPLYQLPLFATMAAGCGAICLGIAQVAIDALLEVATSKVSATLGPSLRDVPAVQAAVAAAAAEVDAARLLLHAALGDVWTACVQGGTVTEAQRARLWESSVHAAKTARPVVTAMFDAAGSAALYQDCLLERAYRDIQAVVQHAVIGLGHFEDAGRVRLGLAPTNPNF
jgi:alkylation response protein AidB-like acyl-CoA dehydrogenase